MSVYGPGSSRQPGDEEIVVFGYLDHEQTLRSLWR
jgi:hypothetical protein